MLIVPRLASSGATSYVQPMMDPELLAMLVCPKTHQDLGQASADEVARINEAIRNGQIFCVGNRKVTEPVDGALIRADRAIAYPIRDEIPVMLIEEGLNLSQIDLPVESGVHRNG